MGPRGRQDIPGTWGGRPGGRCGLVDRCDSPSSWWPWCRHSGTLPGPCPAPGTQAAICRLCGGADRGCDAAVGSVPGTGGSDDFSAAEIGFAASCSDVTVPGGASCEGTVTTLADVAACVRGASDFAAACLDLSAVPAHATYPAVCSGDVGGACGATLFTEPFAGADGPGGALPLRSPVRGRRLDGSSYGSTITRVPSWTRS